MTNYNERLDEIIQVLAMGEQGVADDFAVGAIDEGTYQVRDDVARGQAKQSLTSLIKELVAEAKPLLKERTTSTEFTTWDRKTKVVKTFESETDPGFNKAINEFEQNLLKALEEV